MWNICFWHAFKRISFDAQQDLYTFAFLTSLDYTENCYSCRYHEDVAAVKDSFKKMLEDGVYKADLFADL